MIEIQKRVHKSFIVYGNFVVNFILIYITFLMIKNVTNTLIGETFTRETFANFANFHLFRESLSCESFQNGNSRKFIQ